MWAAWQGGQSPDSLQSKGNLQRSVEWPHHWRTTGLAHRSVLKTDCGGMRLMSNEWNRCLKLLFTQNEEVTLSPDLRGQRICINQTETLTSSSVKLTSHDTVALHRFKVGSKLSMVQNETRISCMLFSISLSLFPVISQLLTLCSASNTNKK